MPLLRAFEVPEAYELVAMLSPRVASVRRNGRTLVCKRPSFEFAERERELLAAIGLSGAAPCAPHLVEAACDRHGPYLVTEFIPNASLGEGLATIRRCFESLARLHEASFVHGDVSPNNVRATTAPEHVVFVDWELGYGANVPPLPRGPFRGTMRFVAPEVARGEAPSTASDVFSLALSCLEMLGGTKVRTEVGPAGLVRAAEVPIDHETYLARFVSRDVGERASRFFLHALAHDANERPHAYAALALL